MLKKMIALVVALGILAGMLPAAASATPWKHGHNSSIVQNVELGFTGQLGFTSEVGGVQCQVTAKATLFAAQTTGAMDTLAAHPAGPATDCKGTGGLAFCQVQALQPTNLPWTFHQTGSKEAPNFQLTYGHIYGEQQGGFCPYKHFRVTGSEATLQPTPATATTITGVHVGGTTQGHVHNQTPPETQSTFGMQLTGTLNIEAPNSGTYGI